jgi:methylmalonyl-CoA/ethylmalonyl-CoA epimerase
MQLVQVALRSSDLARSRAWWSVVLEAEPRACFDPPGLLFYDLDGVRLLLDAGGPVGTVYVRVADMAATTARLAAAGIPLTTEPHVIFRHDDDTLGPAGYDEQMAFTTDPDGNLVGLICWVGTD